MWSANYSSGNVKVEKLSNQRNIIYRNISNKLIRATVRKRLISLSLDPDFMLDKNVTKLLLHSVRYCGNKIFDVACNEIDKIFSTFNFSFSNYTLTFRTIVELSFSPSSNKTSRCSTVHLFREKLLICTTTLRRTFTSTSDKRSKMYGIVYEVRAITEITACRTNGDGSYPKWKMKIFVTSSVGSFMICNRQRALIAWTRTCGEMS